MPAESLRGRGRGSKQAARGCGAHGGSTPGFHVAIVGYGPTGATLGRSRQCDVVLDDPNVSRQHAEIRPRGGSWVVTDLGSTNGSQLNGRRIEGPEVLKPGDEIKVGTSVVAFELE